MSDEEMLRLAKSLCAIRQNDSEILWAVEQMRAHLGKPAKCIMEIGCLEGGSLAMWSQLLADDGFVIGVTLHDDPEHLQGLVMSMTGKQAVIINERSELDTTRQNAANPCS